MANKIYSVVVTDSVRQFILKLPAGISTRIENSLLQLQENPRPTGCKN
jgi:mRNA-degrading endonuclease RelE of RelBE toxin-antitoxin system